MSPTHSTSGATASKCRPTRSRAAFRLPGRVSDLRFFGGRPYQPRSAMISATVFTDTCQPSAHRSKVILGEP
jgi:hypothetical protein